MRHPVAVLFLLLLLPGLGVSEPPAEEICREADCAECADCCGPDDEACPCCFQATPAALPEPPARYVRGDARIRRSPRASFHLAPFPRDILHVPRSAAGR